MTFLVHSSIGKWGGQLKTTRREIQDFYDFRIERYKKLRNKDLK